MDEPSIEPRAREVGLTEVNFEAHLQIQLVGFGFGAGIGKQPLSGYTAMGNLACDVFDEACKLGFNLNMEIEESS